MATLALAAVGAAAGSAFLPAGVSLLGVTLSGAAIGSQLGALAGSYVDQALFGSSGETKPLEGPQQKEISLTTSTEGSPIPRVYGRARLGGQIIWASDFIQKSVTTTQQVAGGGGGGKGAPSSRSTTARRVDYHYFANFAVALAEGEISGIGRVWANGELLDLSRVTHRIYYGTESQNVDSLIQAHEGDKATAYRGTAYIVFEELPINDFGYRVPQLSFEVYRSVESFGEQIKSVVLIPGSGEFVYSTGKVARNFGSGASQSENVHTLQGETDWEVSLDQMQTTLPNVGYVSLIVSWFGTDLRAGHCDVVPGVELAAKTTSPISWKVNGVTRGSAHIISKRNGRPAYGGTPSDQTVIAAINDLKDRGIAVTLTPFILMDVSETNSLANPYGGASQPAYPWRGRITCDPAPGLAGSPDKTAAAGAQLQSFIGTATTSDFSVVGGEVLYSGPAEWSYRRMVLHQAYLAKAAGGVDSFLIGTELRGLTWVRDGPGNYPFVDALKTLAADVKSVLGANTKVSYAADWSEYFGHQPADGSGDVYFHLDPLWASPSIDAIGIDCYWPLSDWRDGRDHIDYSDGTRSIYDLDYLKSNIRGGEGFDWYYASSADRDAQVRTPITDGAGKPWVFRYKDILNWWKNTHYDRPGGIESAVPTAWVPESKPFWLMEIGSSAADKGSNQPNVFVDPKSSENALPYYSNGSRDDLIQRRYLRALIEGFDPASKGYVSGANPVSSVYGGRMLDTNRIFVYCWDARPYPAFPHNLEVWGDGENWSLGHWLNGRFASAPLAELVEKLLEDYSFFDHNSGPLHGTVPGFVIDRIMSPRDALQPLGLAYFFDVLESGGRIVFRHRGEVPSVVGLNVDGLVETDADESLVTLTRGQETELPLSAKLTYIMAAGDYRQAVVESRRLTGHSGRVSQAQLPIVLEAQQATQIAETWLFESWVSRERARFSLPPSQLGLEPGDILALDVDGDTRDYRITEVNDRGTRDIEALGIDLSIYDVVAAPNREASDDTDVLVGQPDVTFLDLPLLLGDESPSAGYVAVSQSPWPGAAAVYGSPEDSGFSLRALAATSALIGETLDPVPQGPGSRFDYGTKFRVSVQNGELTSVSRALLFQGENAAVVRGHQGEWEIIQYENAVLIAEGVYELSGLLRGQAGTEGALAPVGQEIAAGAKFVRLNGALEPIDLTLDELHLPYTWRVGPADRDLGDGSYSEQVHAFRGVGLRPYSPVHVRGVRVNDDLTISWIRRTRVSGDSWDVTEVLLGEETEAYEIDILDGGAVKRTLHATSPTVTYMSAQQIADFGSVQSSVSVTVYQTSVVWGRGSPAQAVV